ncbi:(+)-neomenthol dehydrogenase-like [Quercus lobata]|uniref:(+)-neomenthol dehydrogenase-like n=1 Tax=Quercus lobata TaxID=97700 RepID=UPI0012457D1F|nr:(+)-neomenthol dehydrogenase-like [Quercus lobata]
MAETTINPGIKRIAVVTGGNKGIGFEICRQLASNGVRVVLTARDVRKGNEAIEKLKAAGCSDVVFHQLDVMDPTTISSLADFIKTHFGKLDILVNNAGINGSISNPEERRKVSADQIFGPNAIPLKEIMKQTYQTAEDCLRTNYYGTKQVSKALIPLLLLSNSGRIVNVSSILGQLKVNNAGITGSITNPEEHRKLCVDQIFGPNAIPLKEVMKQTYQTTENCLRTNYYGTKQVSEALIPLLLLSNSGRMVNVSSTLGQLKLISNAKAKKELGEVDDLTEEKVDKVVEGFLEDVKENLIETKGWPVNISAYIVSKAALNAYTRVLAKKYPKIAINSVNPGYTSTDLNHNSGVLTVEEGAKGPVMLVLMPEGGPSGLFFDQMEVSTFE